MEYILLVKKGEGLFEKIVWGVLTSTPLGEWVITSEGKCYKKAEALEEFEIIRRWNGGKGGGQLEIILLLKKAVFYFLEREKESYRDCPPLYEILEDNFKKFESFFCNLSCKDEEETE
jgi:hypothetical protein